MTLQQIRAKKGYICDMDGVLYHGNRLLDGAAAFVDWLNKNDKKYLFLTNSSERSPRELSQKLKRLGLEVDESHFYTSAIATAAFLALQKPGGSAYVIGDAGLINAIYDAGFSMNDINPDYVVVGETQTYSYEKIKRATRLVVAGAKLIGANPDISAPGENGILPATKALIAPIEIASGKTAYFIGKPNPLIMRHARHILGLESSDIAVIGDRMDTDIVAGIESGIDTVLVMTGVTTNENITMFPYSPKSILGCVGDIAE